jgi:hypothetical protein
VLFVLIVLIALTVLLLILLIVLIGIVLIELPVSALIVVMWYCSRNLVCLNFERFATVVRSTVVQYGRSIKEFAND